MALASSPPLCSLAPLSFKLGLIMEWGFARICANLCAVRPVLEDPLHSPPTAALFPLLATLNVITDRELKFRKKQIAVEGWSEDPFVDELIEQIKRICSRYDSTRDVGVCYFGAFLCDKLVRMC